MTRSNSVGPHTDIHFKTYFYSCLRVIWLIWLNNVLMIWRCEQSWYNEFFTIIFHSQLSWGFYLFKWKLKSKSRPGDSISIEHVKSFLIIKVPNFLVRWIINSEGECYVCSTVTTCLTGEKKCRDQPVFFSNYANIFLHMFLPIYKKTKNLKKKYFEQKDEVLEVMFKKLPKTHTLSHL